MEKASATRQTAAKKSGPASLGLTSAPQFTANPMLRLQQSIGNQAMLQLFRDGVLQAKLVGSPPGDPYEQEADRAAKQVVGGIDTGVIQRKCACGGTCSECAGEDEERRVPRLQLSALSSRVQRAAKDAAAQQEAKVPESDRGPTLGLIVEDEAPISHPGQMKKSTFFDLLEADICATADAELAAVGRSTKSCPYIEKWLAFYRHQSGAHIERALLKYAPEAADATSARDYIRDVRHRVRRAVAIWAKTGRVTGIPPGVGLMPSKDEGGEKKKDEGFGTGLLRAISGAGRAQFKEREGATSQPADAESVRDQLGHGRPLDSRIRGRMESAFGSDFSSVRVHDDGSAWGLSSQLNARAFTVGNNIAFGAGEYKPGTLVGEALIAHELAHVVQQGAATQTNAPMLKGDGNYDALEADADVSAVGAVASMWGTAKGKLADIGRNAAPQLKSGLKVQSCRRTVHECPRGLRWAVVGEPAATGPVCVCAWRCLPPGVGFSLSSPSAAESSGPQLTCQNPDIFGKCPGEPDYVKVDEDYEKKNEGKIKTIVGVGAHMSPLGGQAACGCLPLDIEGSPTGEKEVHAPLLPPGVDITDVLAPMADVAAARKSSAKPQVDPTTGKTIPGKSAPAPEHDVRPKVTVVGDLGVDVAASNARAAQYREKFNVAKRRNVAFADYDVAGKKGTLVGVSGEAEREGTVPVPSSPELPTIVTGHTREFDSEKKILEKLTIVLGDNPDAAGTVYLFSEKDVCAGCDLAIAAFRTKYPKIDLRVVSGKK